MLDVGQQSLIVLGPVLLRLFQEEARLYFGVCLSLGTLHTPPLLALEVLGELGQLAPVDTDRHVAELGRVVRHHLSSSVLVQLLHGHFRGRHVGEDSECTVLTLVHSGITVGDMAHIMFHLFQLVEHLLASVVLQDRLRGDLGLLDKVEAGRLDLILLVLVHVREVQLLASFLLQVLAPLNDRLYGRLRAIELTQDVRSLLRLKPQLLLLECLVHRLNFFAIGGVAFVAKLTHGPRIGDNFGHGVLRIGVPDGQEVVVVEHLASLLHNSEGALSARPLHVPANLIVNSLSHSKEE